jgi:hypothetical protein
MAARFHDVERCCAVPSIQAIMFVLVITPKTGDLFGPPNLRGIRRFARRRRRANTGKTRNHRSDQEQRGQEVGL